MGEEQSCLRRQLTQVVGVLHRFGHRSEPDAAVAPERFVKAFVRFAVSAERFAAVVAVQWVVVVWWIVAAAVVVSAEQIAAVAAVAADVGCA